MFLHPRWWSPDFHDWGHQPAVLQHHWCHPLLAKPLRLLQPHWSCNSLQLWMAYSRVSLRHIELFEVWSVYQPLELATLNDSGARLVSNWGSVCKNVANACQRRKSLDPKLWWAQQPLQWMLRHRYPIYILHTGQEPQSWDYNDSILVKFKWLTCSAGRWKVPMMSRCLVGWMAFALLVWSLEVAAGVEVESGGPLNSISRCVSSVFFFHISPGFDESLMIISPTWLGNT